MELVKSWNKLLSYVQISPCYVFTTQESQKHAIASDNKIKSGELKLAYTESSIFLKEAK